MPDYRPARDGTTLRRMRSRLTPFVAACIVLAACALPESSEQELGDAMAAQVASEMTLSSDTTLDRWLDALGARLVASADAPGRSWQFTVVDSDDLNAFAIPGGHIYVNSGLLRRAETMSEVAGVLGHEVAHVTLRHTARQFGSRTRRNVIVGVFCAVTGWCSGDLAQLAIQVGGAALTARHSRADEAQSDSAAVAILNRAGIDPSGVTRMFERMARERAVTPGVVDAFFSSHPLDEERVAATRAMVEGLPRPATPWQVDDSTFPGLRPVAPAGR